MIEERERREEEDLARARGYPMNAHGMGMPFNTSARIEGQLGGVGGKKRKDAPVVSAKGAAAGVKTSLSLDEAHTVQQLMGMKTNSPPMGGLPSHAPLPAFPGHPGQQMISPGAHAGDNESERLKMELAHAMNARLESEHRIQLLKQQMTVHHARTRRDEHARAAHAAAHSQAQAQAQAAAHAQAQAAAHSRAAAARGPPSPRSALNATLPAGYEHYLSMLAGGSPAPHPAAHRNLHRRAPAAPNSQSPEQKPQAPDLANLEKELLKEALIRRLVPPGAAATGTAPHPIDARASAYEEAMSRLAKRARYSEDGEAAAKKSAEEQDARRASSADHAARAPSADPMRSDELGFYQDLYSKLVAPRHPPQSPRESAPAGYLSRDPVAAARDFAARDPAAAHAAARDLAYFDSLAAARNLSHHGMPPSEQAAVQHAFLDSMARGGGGGHPPQHLPPGLQPQHNRPPSARMSPYPPPGHPSDLRHGGQGSYSNILAQIAAGRGAPAGAAARAPSAAPPLPTPPPPPANDSPSARAAVAANLESQFGLSYNDIMDVWKEMNEKKKAGELGDNADRGANQEGKKEEE